MKIEVRVVKHDGAENGTFQYCSDVWLCDAEGKWLLQLQDDDKWFHSLNEAMDYGMNLVEYWDRMVRATGSILDDELAVDRVLCISYSEAC